MSTAVRRASTGLSFSQVGKLSRSSSKASLKVETAQAPAPSSEDLHAVPSPVAESPAREAEATAEVSVPPIGPSPLATVTVAEDSAPSPATPARVLEPERDQVTASPEQVPVVLPPQPLEPSPQPLGFSDPILPTVSVPVVESPVVVPQDVPAPIEPEVAPPLPEPTPVSTLPLPSAEPPVPSAVEEHRADYFAFGDPIPAVLTAQDPVAEPVPQVMTPPPEPAPTHEVVPSQDVSHVQIPTDASTFAWSDEPALGHKASRTSFSEPIQHSAEPSGKVSSRASKSSLSTSYGQLLPDQQRGRSSSVRSVFVQDVLCQT